MQLTDFFDEIYCINLDDRTDRWEEVLLEFEKLGIKDKVKRFSAEKNENGAVGCRNSHLAIVKEAKERGLKNILIFEDDVLVINENIQYIEDVLAQLSHIDDYHLFYLGLTVDPHQSFIKFNKVSNNILTTNFAYTTHAYAINSSIFDYIINNAYNHHIIDVFYCHNIVKGFNKSYCTNPMLCIQRETFSDIQKHTGDYLWMIDFFNKIKQRSLIQ